ncbi:MAG: nitroreductase family protein [Acidobacteriota bacterium]
MKKIFIILWGLTVFFILDGFLPAQEKNQPGLSLKETFVIYVQSVQNSDLESLFTTVTDEERLVFLTATGRLIDSRQGYYSFHEEWFKEEDWKMPVELLEINEGQEFGYTIAKFFYKGRTKEGGYSAIDSYFTLIFRREEGMWKVAADICTPIKRYYVEKDSGLEYLSEQIYFFDIIKNRRTVRKFKPTPVPKEHILKILDAARLAPTAGNQQPWKFLVIEDRNRLNKFQDAAREWFLEKYKKRQPTEKELKKTTEALQKTMSNVLSAPIYVAVLVDSEAKYPDYVIYDGTLAAGYLMIVARALGYGTGFFTTFFPEEKMKDLFNIPKQYKLICFTPIGIPSEWPDTPPKENLEDVVFFESF